MFKLKGWQGSALRVFLENFACRLRIRKLELRQIAGVKFPNSAQEIEQTFLMFKMNTFSSKNVSSAALLCFNFNFRPSPSPLLVTRSANNLSRCSLSSTDLSPLLASLTLSNTSASTYSWKISLQEYKSLCTNLLTIMLHVGFYETEPSLHEQDT